MDSLFLSSFPHVYNMLLEDALCKHAGWHSHTSQNITFRTASSVREGLETDYRVPADNMLMSGFPHNPFGVCVPFDLIHV